MNISFPDLSKLNNNKLEELLFLAKETGCSKLTFKIGKTDVSVMFAPPPVAAIKKELPKEEKKEGKEVLVTSDCVGKVQSVLKKGNEVIEGDMIAVVLILEQEQEILSPCSGKINKVFVSIGAPVYYGTELVRIISQEEGNEGSG